eukprot:5015496-Pleurochrysis_carterae.AAC.1
MIIANALAGRIALNSARIPPDGSDERSPPDTRLRRHGQASVNSPPTSDPSLQPTDSASPSQPPLTNETTNSDDASLREHFQRGLGAYPL